MRILFTENFLEIVRTVFPRGVAVKWLCEYLDIPWKIQWQQETRQMMGNAAGSLCGAGDEKRLRGNGQIRNLCDRAGQQP